MKAAVLHGNNDIRYEDYPIPEVKPGTVKIRIKATGICGSDIPRVLNGGAHFYPIVLGHEFAGDIVEIGEGVTGLSINDTVTGAPLLPCHKCPDCENGNHALCKNYSFIGSREQGSFAEYVVIPVRNAVKYDPSIPYEQAAMFEPATVALHGLFLAGYQGGCNVAILGGGNIGLFTMQWAKILGAKSVTVFDIDDDRLMLASHLGADFIINTKQNNPTRAYEYVFETAGSTATMRLAFELAANKAKVCFIGTPHEDLIFTPRQWENMNRKEFTLTGSWMSYSAPFPGQEWELTAHYFTTGQLKFDSGLIYNTYPLNQAAEAFELFKEPGRVKGKIILKP
ncbi:MAG: galactitol-1-phosphate 5-dehydrogenase [Defluviitaleaceae bacterium]|nr:galactitol-1-phosphate 5-dehydrogenase [Defluviitaleaceae bacterium]